MLETLKKKNYNSTNAGEGLIHITCRLAPEGSKCFCGYQPKGNPAPGVEVTCVVCASFIGKPCPFGHGHIVA